MSLKFDDEPQVATTVATPMQDLVLAKDQLPAVHQEQPIRVVVVTDEQIERLGDQQASQLSALSRQILSQVRASDMDDFGKNLNDLIGTAKGLDPSKYNQKGIIAFIRNLFGSVKEQMLAEYSTVESRMNELVKELDKSTALHTKRITDLEDMYVANIATHKSLEKCVEDGQNLLVELNKQLEGEKVATDAFAAQRLADIQNRIDRLEKRIDDLRRSMLLAKQAAPEIRLLQDNARTLASKFKDVKTVTIPAWQNAFALYLVVLEQGKGAALANKIHDSTDEAFKKQADLLRQNTQLIAHAKQRSVVSIDTLEHVQNQLLGACDDMKKIADEGKRSRAQAESKLEQLEQQLIDKFIPQTKQNGV